MNDTHERLVRAFYASTAPGYRERLWGLQATEVVYELPAGMPTGGGRFVGLLDVTDRFLASFYGAFDVVFLPEDFVAHGDQVVVLGRIAGATRRVPVPVQVPFAHVWTVREGRLQRLRGFTDTAVLAEALAREEADQRFAGGSSSSPR